MELATATVSAQQTGVKGILWGGALAGVLDLTYAFVMSGLRGRTPLAVLRSVASGLLGESAAQGGAGVAALGAFLHFVVAFGAAAVYFLASRRLRFLVQHAVVSGILFGIAVYAFMNLVVIPLSAFPFNVSYPLRVLVPGLLAHMFLVGLPISLSVRRFSARQPQTR